MMAKMLLVLGSLVASVLLAELLAREVMYGSLSMQQASVDEAKFFQADSVTGWGHVPGVEGVFANPGEGYRAWVTIDQLGVRSNASAFAAALNGSPEILILGDSNTAGFEVDDDKTFAARLEQLLFERGCSYRVYNAGVRGYGTDQAYWQLLRLRESIDPELTIYLFTFNDLMDNRTIKRLRKVYSKPAYAYERDHLELIKPKSPALGREYYAYLENSADGYRLVEGTSQGLLVDLGFLIKENLAISHLLLPIYYQFFDPRVALESPDQSEIEVDLRIFGELLRLMQASSRRFVVTEFPTGRTEFRLRAALNLGDLGIEYVDLFPYFTPPVEQYHWKTDVHWNELGHETAARALLSELQDELCADVTAQRHPSGGAPGGRHGATQARAR